MAASAPSTSSRRFKCLTTVSTLAAMLFSRAFSLQTRLLSLNGR